MEKELLLLAELKKNCEGKEEKLMDLLKAYELAELGRDVQRQHFKDIENKVLQENEFFCEREFTRDSGIKVGERILSKKYDFLLSDKEFSRLQAMLLPHYVKANLTDEKGYYITNWDMIACEARCKLVDFIIMEIVPKEFFSLFHENRNSIIFQEKLINAFKKSLKPAA